MKIKRFDFNPNIGELTNIKQFDNEMQRNF